ncbi:integrator complex subunit 7 [Diorhabda carinulata]|uniref:integrator complex subunit 7 n=1 Tax=Diorhabda carinulata TaxID=1163345 RepID=UPI0025A0374B|nr:integrator complex subunit 7 [Diorhabda carinulata]
MMGVRVNTFNENNLGEPDQDANSALTELDKGLRSAKVGEQCEAIVRFPKLFEKYPFPILINASLLKLADVFRMGNNFLRLCVLRVCQQSEKHLDKISNVDEFVRRIYTVIHSNDPIARAVTIRIFGAVAAIIPERQQIQHCIRSSLDSHDSVEVEAAIYGAVQFAAQSKTFAISMCNKVSDMIQRQSTPANMKLQLIPILQYMHHDTNTSAMVRSLCIELLPGYPAVEFVLVTLNALTKLAEATLVDIPSQVNLLLNYLKSDPRWEIKLRALQHLYELAKPGAHLWPPGAIDEIINFALNTDQKKILSPSLRVLQVLVESPKMCYEHRSSGSKLRELCYNHCYSPEPKIGAQAIQILSHILCYCYKENIPTEGEEEITAALETLILLLTFMKTKHSVHLKTVLKCAVQLCEAKDQFCEIFVELLGTRLDNVDGDNTLTICETLGAIGSLRPETLVPLIDTIINILTALNEIREPTQLQTQTKTMLCTLMFQTLCGHKWNEDTFDIVMKVVGNNNMWANYCIARAAMRYGHHKVAHHIFLGLTEQVSSEHFHFWLICLKELSKAECELYSEDSETLITRLDSAVIHYNKAIAALKAASTPQHNLAFQAEYMKIRTDYLHCLLQLIYSCNILCIVPPPAIAATLVQNTRDEYQRHGYITNQLRKCAKDFKNCGDMHWKLYQTTFDADPATLEIIQILQQTCVLLEKCVESLCVSGTKLKDEYIEFGSKQTKLESQQLVKACENALKIAQSVSEENNSTITHSQVEVLKKIIEILINASLPIPRYFFQILQSTSVKLAISPQPRVLGEFISVQAGSQLAVKVEGVIQHGMKPGLFRKIDEVIINVTSQLQTNPKNKDSLDPKLLEQVSILTQTVTPHKDFFTAQFLLAFPRGGQYLLSVEASVIDEETNIWKTGPKSTLTVKVPEETKLAPITVPGMANNANVILMPEDSLFVRPQQKKTI